MKWLRLFFLVIIAGGLVWLLAYGFTRDARYIYSPLIGRMAPPFTLTGFDGKTIKLEELRGKVVFLNFWASWCPPCRAEARTLEAAWQQFKDGDVVFLGVNIQDTEVDARAFLKEFGVTYLNGWDPAGRVAIDMGCGGFRRHFFSTAKAGSLSSRSAVSECQSFWQSWTRLSTGSRVPKREEGSTVRSVRRHGL